MSWLDQRRHKSVVDGPTTTNATRGRTSRQAHLPQKSQQPRPRPRILDGPGISGGGGCDATSEALLLPGRQPPPALFTPTVRTKPHKTDDSAGARREKLASKIIGAAAPDHDHGKQSLGHGVITPKTPARRPRPPPDDRVDRQRLIAVVRSAGAACAHRGQGW